MNEHDTKSALWDVIENCLRQGATMDEIHWALTEIASEVDALLEPSDGEAGWKWLAGNVDKSNY